MLRRASLVALVVLVAGSACTMSSGGRRGAIIAGATMSATSILLIRSGANDSDRDGVNENILNDNWGAYYLGTGLLFAGITTLLVGVASTEETIDPTVTYHPTAAQMPSLPTPVFASASTGTPAGPAPELASMPPEGTTRTVELERRPIAPLPALATSDEVVRLAKQVRSAATFFRCEAAWIMWMDVQKLDASYARALRDGPVMASCAN